jgi:hypothetical protein
MPNSQFNSPATLRADGTIEVNGPLEVDPPARNEDVEVRFMLVQDDAVVEGTGRGQGSGWVGSTVPGTSSLEAGPVQAVGLFFHARTAPDPGYETFTWSDSIALERGGPGPYGGTAQTATPA